MGIKILLGILLGFLAGASAKDYTQSGNSEKRLVAPEITSTGKDGLSASAGIAVFSAVIFIISTFIKYPLPYGFMALGEVVLGAFFAGFLGYPFLRMVGFAAGPLAILFYILL